MKWLNFLHLYQPANQQPDILEAVVKQSYLPIFKELDRLENVNITLNISGSLFELFERDGHTELLDHISNCVRQKKVELTGSCKYHTFIPLVDEDLIRRQIEQNKETLEKFLGFAYRPRGFFPPEMGYHPKLLKILQEFGYEWLIIDEIAGFDGANYPKPASLYKIANTELAVFFRNRRASNLIMSAAARDTTTLKTAFHDDFTLPYLVTGMDGETFGHHRIGLELFLFEILKDSELSVTGISSFLDSPHGLKTQTIEPKSSTWASSLSDIERGVQFLSWQDPANALHKIQWEFVNFTLTLVRNYPKNAANYAEIWHKLDIAMASDHFWWASAKPWWSLEMIENGAYNLLDVLQSMEAVSQDIMFTAYKYYQDIVSTASAWQRQGIVRKMASEQNKILRIPFKERTLETNGELVPHYYAFIELMQKQEKQAAEKGDYEKAILWRDAVYKLTHKYDIYDSLNVIDLLRIEVGNGEVEAFLEKYTQDYQKLRGGQPEQRGS